MAGHPDPSSQGCPHRPRRPFLGFAAIACLLAASWTLPGPARADLLVVQDPISGGGVMRASQLWQDPTPAGNNLDGDSVCWQDFTLTSASKINHIEWWGNGASELGFQVEFWRQDPNTIAYQPLAVFEYGYYGPGSPPVSPESRFVLAPSDITTSSGPGGLTHYSADLVSPVTLAANDPANPRWFVGIIGLTSQAYYTWNWAQGTGGSTHTFQFIRGGNEGGGDRFQVLGDGRALILGGTRVVPEPGSMSLLLSAAVTAATATTVRRLRRSRSRLGSERRDG